MSRSVMSRPASAQRIVPTTNQQPVRQAPQQQQQLIQQPLAQQKQLPQQPVQQIRPQQQMVQPPGRQMMRMAQPQTQQTQSQVQAQQVQAQSQQQQRLQAQTQAQMQQRQTQMQVPQIQQVPQVQQQVPQIQQPPRITSTASNLAIQKQMQARQQMLQAQAIAFQQNASKSDIALQPSHQTDSTILQTMHSRASEQHVQSSGVNTTTQPFTPSPAQPTPNLSTPSTSSAFYHKMMDTIDQMYNNYQMQSLAMEKLKMQLLEVSTKQDKNIDQIRSFETTCKRNENELKQTREENVRDKNEQKSIVQALSNKIIELTTTPQKPILKSTGLVRCRCFHNNVPVFKSASVHSDIIDTCNVDSMLQIQEYIVVPTADESTKQNKGSFALIHKLDQNGNILKGFVLLYGDKLKNVEYLGPMDTLTSPLVPYFGDFTF